MKTHTTPLTVRPYECDPYGHVNHANYLHYLEVARLDYMRAVGFDYHGLLAAGYIMPITHIDIAYRAAALSEDELTIESTPVIVRRVTGSMKQTIRRGDTVVVEALVEWCIVDRAGRPARPPEAYDLRSAVE